MERGCELCDATAALYCGADEAYICWSCDVKVHSANFLVARHTRMVLCKICCRPTTLRASGADPTPLSHLCVSCSSESECNKSLDPLEEGEEAVSVDMMPLRSSSAGASESGYGSGCVSCNNLEERSEVEKNSGGGQKRRALPVETISSAWSKEEDFSTQARTSVESLDGSHVTKKRRLSPGLPDTAEQTGQGFGSLEDVKRAGVANTQCDRSRPTTTQDGERETQANVGEGADTPSTTMSSRRSFNTGVHCPSKQPQAVDSSQMRSSLPARNYQHASSVQSTARLRRILAEWHWDLNLSSPTVVPLALRLYRKVVRALCPANNASSAVIRSTLAACLRLAAILDDAQINVPKPHEFASCAAISRRHLAMTEIQLTAFLGRGRLLMSARGLTIERPQ